MKFFIKIFFLFFIFISLEVFAGVEEDLKKLKDLLDSETLTQEQYNTAVSKLKGESSDPFEFYGIPIGGIVDVQNQTIGGKKFKFLNHGQADNLYYWRSDRNWKTKSGSQYIWTGREGKDWYMVDMVVIKDPIRKDKLKSYSIKFAYFNNVPKVFWVDIDDNFEMNNRELCKKLSKEMYMLNYETGYFEISKKEHTDNLLDAEVKILENETYYMEFLCGGDTLGDFSMWVKDINLDHDVTLMQN